ncbi:zinc finger HIT domain-containing protein 3 [Teleopsis dalmanni]|uniref:zinc finger HIT domain-containing protein 3 n=1 Tax=Teleopsis dalmanni TaxID=139649 RepID=UPI0018CE6F64|nr:zinc finger HIT domain-containing protein 3 [Teleopsis dalmanni]
MSACTNCQDLTRKYRCPKCLEPYCSLKCFKEHKEKNCEQKQLEDTKAEELEGEEQTCHEAFPTNDTVPKALLENLKYSSELRSLLQNSHLRNLLREIDVARNVNNAMTAAMHEPLFLEFADTCLKVVDPMTEEEVKEAKLLHS